MTNWPIQYGTRDTEPVSRPMPGVAISYFLEYLLLESGCHAVEEAQTAQWRGPGRKELRPLINSPSLIPSQPTVSTNLPTMWVSHLRNRSWSPSWPIPAGSTWNKNKLGPNCIFVSKLNDCYYFGSGLLYENLSPECPNLICPNCKLTLILTLFPNKLKLMSFI